MAKRIQFSQHGGPEVLTLVDFEPAAPGPQQVRVRNHAIGLNFIDTYFRSGLYAPPALPSGLGTEAAGVVEAVGEGVTRIKVGDRVAYAGGPLGAYSEVHTLPEANLVKLPESISFEQAAAVMLKGLTVQYLLRQTYALQAGQTVLFHAAAGGVGSLACQWAKALGVKLIGTVSSPEKAARAKALGAWETIDYSREDVAQRVLELTGAARADGELRQCVGRGERSQSGDPGAEGLAVCDPADAGQLCQQCREHPGDGRRAVRNDRQRQAGCGYPAALSAGRGGQGSGRAVGAADGGVYGVVALIQQ